MHSEKGSQIVTFFIILREVIIFVPVILALEKAHSSLVQIFMSPHQLHKGSGWSLNSEWHLLRHRSGLSVFLSLQSLPHYFSSLPVSQVVCRRFGGSCAQSSARRTSGSGWLVRTTELLLQRPKPAASTASSSTPTPRRRWVERGLWCAVKHWRNV